MPYNPIIEVIEQAIKWIKKQSIWYKLYLVYIALFSFASGIVSRYYDKKLGLGLLGIVLTSIAIVAIVVTIIAKRRKVI